MALKWGTDAADKCGESFSFSQASWTKAVELRVTFCSFLRSEPAQFLIYQAEEVVQIPPLFVRRTYSTAACFLRSRHDGFSSQIPQIFSEDESGDKKHPHVH
jgi:hypothetical protein